MSTPILPFAVWESGTNQNSVPANDNSLRNQILNGLVISDTTDAQPALVSPADDGTIYIMTGAATGLQWSTFDEFDLAIFMGGTWYAFAPVEGVTVNLAGALVSWDGAAYVPVTGDSGSPGGADKNIQYNDGGTFGGEAGFEYDKTTNTQTVANQTLTALQNLAKGTNIASAGTTDIAAATGNYVHVTGTTTITALGTAQAGAERVVVFDGILTLTHNGTSLILPTGASITTAAGDVACFVSEGSGNWKCVFYQRADGTPVAGGGGGLTGFTSALNTASPNNTVNASSLTPSGGTTNQVGVYASKGNGAIQARIADSAATGGNVRGANAVDWQQTRLAATQVASAQTSTISGGTANTASNTNATVGGGSTNNASGNASTIGGGSSNAASSTGSLIAGGSNNIASTGIGATVCGGDTNTSSNTRAFVGSGFGNVASGEYSWIAGGIQGTTRGTWGASAHSSGQFAAVGDAQHRSFVLRSDTTNATPEAVSTDNSAAAAANQIVLPNNSAFMIKGTVVCRENATGDTSAWEFTALIKRGANAAATALVAAATISAPIQDAGAATWTLGITANTTLGGLTITVTGEAAHNIKWVTDVYSCNEVVG